LSFLFFTTLTVRLFQIKKQASIRIILPHHSDDIKYYRLIHTEYRLIHTEINFVKSVTWGKPFLSEKVSFSISPVGSVVISAC